MKRILALLFASLIALPVFAEDDGSSLTITPQATSIATVTTNSTAGAVCDLPKKATRVRLFVTVTGAAGTTNGNFIVKFITSPDNSTYDTASSSNIKITVAMNGATTQTVSDWFELAGAKYIKEGQMENTSAGTVSAIAIKGAAQVP